MSLPRAYLRIDPNMDSHPDQDAMLTLILFGNRCSERGRFRSLSMLEKVLGKKRLKACLDRKDLVPISGGRFYVSGWDEWQEGDLTVGDRMGRIRKRRSMEPQELPENDRNEGVTLPLPDRITGRNSSSEALTLTLGDIETGVEAAPSSSGTTALERAAAPDPFDEKPEERKRAITELGVLCADIAAKEGKEVREVLIENSRTPRGSIITNPSAVSLDWICATIAKLKARGQPIISDNYRRTAEAAARVLVQLKAEQASEPMKEIRR